MTIRLYFIYSIFILALGGSIFSSIKINSISLSVLYTLSADIIPLFFLSKKINKNALIIITPLFLYCLYDLIGFIWGPITKSVIQDFAVWTGMLMLLFISSIPCRNITEKISIIINYSKYAFFFYLLYFALYKIASPATMMLALLYFSYFLSNLVVKKITMIEMFFLFYLIVVPIITGTRIVYIAEVIVFILIFFKFYGNKKSINSKIKKVIIFILAIGIMISIYTVLENRINETMYQGDNATVAGITINTSGRAYMWGHIYESAKENIVFGVGSDVTKDMLQLPRWQHPHNDYLRLLYHNGLIGLTLWLFFQFLLFKFLFNSIKYTNKIKNRKFYIFNLAYLLGISIIMFTDNPIVYSYIMYSLVIVSGTSTILAHNEKKERIIQNIIPK